MASDNQMRNTKQQQHDSSLSSKTHMLGSSNRTMLFFHAAGGTTGNGRKTGRKYEKTPGQLKESLILLHLVSNTIISKYSGLMSDGEKQTPALQWEEII